MSDRLDFLRRIQAAPNDGAPRLVYADWLDERGESVTAEVQRTVGRHLEAEGLTSWQKVWREGFAPIFPHGGMQALLKALQEDDPRLMQGMTTTPPPNLAVQDWPVEGADAIGFVGWRDTLLGLNTVGEVEKFFARSCFEADQRLEEAAGCRWFLNWFDDTPRDQMRKELIPEVLLAILLLEERSDLSLADIPEPPSGNLLLASVDGVLQWGIAPAETWPAPKSL